MCNFVNDTSRVSLSLLKEFLHDELNLKMIDPVLLENLLINKWEHLCNLAHAAHDQVTNSEKKKISDAITNLLDLNRDGWENFISGRAGATAILRENIRTIAAAIKDQP